MSTSGNDLIFGNRKMLSKCWLLVPVLLFCLEVSAQRRPTPIGCNPSSSTEISGNTIVNTGSTYTYSIVGHPEGYWEVWGGTMGTPTGNTCVDVTWTAAGDRWVKYIVDTAWETTVIQLDVSVNGCDAGTLSVSGTSVEYNSTISLTATNAPAGYSFQKCTSATCPTDSDTNWSTASSSTTVTTTTKFRIRASACGETVYSSIRTVTVYPQFNPGSIEFYADDACAPSQIDLNSTFDAEGGKGTIRYQWQGSTNNSSWTDISDPDAGSPSLPNYNRFSFRYYRRIAWSDFNENAESNRLDGNNEPATPPALSAGSINGQEVCSGSKASEITGVAASGGSGSLSYSWSFSSDNVSWSSFRNVNPVEYLGTLTSDTYVKRKVTASLCGGSKTTTSVLLDVINPTAGTISVSPTKPEYGAAVTLSVSGNSGSVKYQRSANGTDNWQDATSGESVTSDRYYRTRLNNTTCGIKTSSKVFVDVYSQFDPGRIEFSTETPCSPSDVTLESQFAANGGKGSPRYQWQGLMPGKDQSKNSDWENISSPNAGSASLGAFTQWAYTKYRRLASSDFLENEPSNVLDVADVPEPFPPLDPGSLNDQFVCLGDDIAPITGIDPAGGRGPLRVLWSFGNGPGDDAEWTDFYDVDPVGFLAGESADTWVRRQVLDEGCDETPPVVTAAALIDFIDPSAGTITVTPLKPRYGASITITVDGNTGPVQFESSISGTGGWEEAVSGETVTEDRYYRARLKDERCGIETSPNVFVDVYPQFDPGVIEFSSETPCSPSDVSLQSQFDAFGGKGEPSYKWQGLMPGDDEEDERAWQDISDPRAGQATLGSFSDWPFTKYRRLASSEFNENEPSNIMDVADAPQPPPSLYPGRLDDQVVCLGDLVAPMTGEEPGGGLGPRTILWSYGNGPDDDAEWSDYYASDPAEFLGQLEVDTWVRRQVNDNCPGPPVETEPALIRVIDVERDVRLRDETLHFSECDQTRPYNIFDGVPPGYVVRWFGRDEDDLSDEEEYLGIVGNDMDFTDLTVGTHVFRVRAESDSHHCVTGFATITVKIYTSTTPQSGQIIQLDDDLCEATFALEGVDPEFCIIDEIVWQFGDGQEVRIAGTGPGAVDLRTTEAILENTTIQHSFDDPWNHPDGYNVRAYITYRCPAVSLCEPTVVKTLNNVVINGPRVELTPSNTNYGCTHFFNYYAQFFDPDTDEELDYVDIIGQRWEFADGTLISRQKAFVYPFSTPGPRDIRLTVQYRCEPCGPNQEVIEYTTEFRQPEDKLTSSLLSEQADIVPQTLSAGSGTFTSAWPLTSTDAAVHDKHPYANGSAGVWRASESFVFNTGALYRTATTGVDLENDGTFPLKSFVWGSFIASEQAEWLTSATNTKYNAFNASIENKDALDIYSAAVYEPSGELPTAVGQNMANDQMGFTSFEYLSENAIDGNFFFGEIDQQASLKLYRTREFDILAGLHNMAIVDIPLDKIADNLTGDVISDATATRVEIVCSGEEEEEGETYVYVAFDQIISESELYRGIYRVKGDEVTYKLQNNSGLNKGHSGSQALALTGTASFPQYFLKPANSEYYFISAWFSPDPSKTFYPDPSIGDSYSMRLIFMDGDDEVGATNSVTVEGPVVEGWQQVSGEVLIDDAYDYFILEINGEGTYYVDDLRLFPSSGNMMSYVYDDQRRLSSTLDENNFATYYDYDAEGNLYLVRKETVAGVQTIQQSVNYVITDNSGDE